MSSDLWCKLLKFVPKMVPYEFALLFFFNANSYGTTIWICIKKKTVLNPSPRIATPWQAIKSFQTYRIFAHSSTPLKGHIPKRIAKLNKTNRHQMITTVQHHQLTIASPQFSSWFYYKDDGLTPDASICVVTDWRRTEPGNRLVWDVWDIVNAKLSEI